MAQDVWQSLSSRGISTRGRMARNQIFLGRWLAWQIVFMMSGSLAME